MDFASKPGLLFVVATLLPLASFVVLLLTFALRSAVRSAPEGSLGERIYQALGGDTPQRWPAWVATGAIGLAFVCSLAGFVWYLSEAPRIEKLKEEAADKRREWKEKRKGKPNEPEAAARAR